MHCENKCQQLDSCENDYCQEKRLNRTKKKKSSYYDTNARVILCIVKINGSNYIHRSIIPNLSCPIITSRHFFLQSSPLPCMVSFSQHDSDYENNKAFFVSCCLIAQLSKAKVHFFSSCGSFAQSSGSFLNQYLRFEYLSSEPKPIFLETVLPGNMKKKGQKLHQFSNTEKSIVFCYQTCSDLLKDKIVIVIEKNF